MNPDDAKTLGLTHYYRGNYYLCRDLWETESRKDLRPEQLAFFQNALGALYDKVKGSTFSRPYFERAMKLLPMSPLTDVSLQARTNLIYVLSRSAYTETALGLIRQTQTRMHTASRFRQALFQVSVLHAYSRAELYREILNRAEEAAQLFVELQPTDLRNEHFAGVYQQAGYAAQMLGQLEQAVSHYQRAQEIWPTPEVLRDLAKVYLFMGEIDRATQCLADLQPKIWRLASATEHAELASTLELLAMFAWLDNQKQLFHKYTEKAELYFGQESRWTEWLHMQDLGNFLERTMKQLPASTASDLHWEEWHDFLDELNLLDVFNTMFPPLWPVLRYVAGLAARIYRQFRGDESQECRQRLEHAARLAYVGLTVTATSATEAAALLRRRDGREKLAEYNVRTFAAYGWGRKYIDIQTACRDFQLRPETAQEQMAAALGIALHYVELIEFVGLSHASALQQVVSDFQQGPTEMLESFLQLFAGDVNSGEIPSA